MLGSTPFRPTSAFYRPINIKKITMDRYLEGRQKFTQKDLLVNHMVIFGSAIQMHKPW
jgi:hypothetical protein